MKNGVSKRMTVLRVLRLWKLQFVNCTNQHQKFYGGFIVWVYIITGSLYGDYDGTRVILVRVMGYVASAIDRAYKIVHIISGQRLKCFVVDLAVVHDVVLVIYGSEEI
ncbi:hypothetical protein KY285_026482 [Solanum tuberosum]|nr:hypothetical protein KY285_026482 [Solanum tuberosum]